MSEGAHPYTWLHAKEREDRELESTVGCSREESGGRASRGGDEDHEAQCVMKSQRIGFVLTTRTWKSKPSARFNRNSVAAM